MTHAHMGTGERFIIDLEPLFETVRSILQEAMDAVWPIKCRYIVESMLPDLFYGSQLFGERKLETKLMSYGVEELPAIKGSRKLYEILLQCLGIHRQEELGSVFYDYFLQADLSLLLLSAHEYRRTAGQRILDADVYLDEIERSIKSGDGTYYPQKLRRLAESAKH